MKLNLSMRECAAILAAATMGFQLTAQDLEKIVPQASAPQEKAESSAKGQDKTPVEAIQKGVNFLTDMQKPDGSWCNHPGITGLACIALHSSGKTQHPAIVAEAVQKGRKYILSMAKKDGSIWLGPEGGARDYPVYTTSICLSSLAIMGNPADEEIMRGARKYLQSCQLTKENPNNPTPEDSDVFGGFSYGNSGPVHADLSNTQWALEALHLTEYLDREPKSRNPEDAKKADLAWSNALKFVSRLQNLPESNDQTWVVKDPKDPQRGGFVYVSPDKMRRGPGGKDNTEKSLRTYGSMTYAGLKSMIYAKLSKDDPRVKAAVEWAEKNYTLDENPGIGEEGLYYYLQTFAKANAVMGKDMIMTPDGASHDWRQDLVKKLVSLQKPDGSWSNQVGKWMESVPELVTSYSLIALECATKTAAPY